MNQCITQLQRLLKPSRLPPSSIIPGNTAKIMSFKLKMDFITHEIHDTKIKRVFVVIIPSSSFDTAQPYGNVEDYAKNFT